MDPMARSRYSGFTLVELVITISVSGVVVAMVAVFLAGPVQGFTDQARRAELVDSAESSLRRVARDIRQALPNSVRIGGAGPVTALELLSTLDGARYRAAPPPANPDRLLDFSAPDDAFNTTGPFRSITKPFSSNSAFLSVYNVGVPGADAYELANVITPPGTQIDITTDAIPGEDNVRLVPAFRFAFGSPRQRVFLVDGPVSYLCDTVNGTLTRFSGYAITTNQSDRDTAAELIGAGAAAALVSDNVSACGFAYSPGTAQRAGLVTISLSVASSGETVSLLHQVHLDNAP